MDEDRDRRAWFTVLRPGRRRLTDWRGAAAFAALMLVTVVGGWAETALRPEHPVLAFVVMVPLALVAIGLAAVIVVRTR
ncbi:hypothetical protein Q8W71_13730 [Methylobacterium sp. NEAU 140]|uniref:hypothetical protein n=1 Tax=Methylobacterium sp. NEAU 140 TaxID=3064945 RepID=UPI002734FBBC|nr:hypothetical protein [Methylobacterium sp. NEAU 140]MDP4023692.1 hypothetical protein [Methylobacterium sp. NEAU 140]